MQGEEMGNMAVVILGIVFVFLPLLQLSQSADFRLQELVAQAGMCSHRCCAYHALPGGFHFQKEIPQALFIVCTGQPRTSP